MALAKSIMGVKMTQRVMPNPGLMRRVIPGASARAFLGAATRVPPIPGVERMLRKTPVVEARTFPGAMKGAGARVFWGQR